jgi:hypothetical protein
MQKDRASQRHRHEESVSESKRFCIVSGGMRRVIGHTCTKARSCGLGGTSHVVFVYLEVMERPRAAPTAADTGVEDRVGAALRLWAMCALTR